LDVKPHFGGNEKIIQMESAWYMVLLFVYMKSKELSVSADTVSSLELRFLMDSIVSQKANVKIKCLFEGRSWSGPFLSVLMVTEKGAVLKDESSDKILSIPFIDHVMQFVLDRPFDSYNSERTYAVA
jgi:hypothetical protein